LSHLFRKRLERNRRVDRFQVIPASLELFRSFGAMQRMFQLDDADRRYDDFRFAVLFFGLVKQIAVGLASRSAAISTLESSTNPMMAASAAHGGR
jgi:hypothetical protein